MEDDLLSIVEKQLNKQRNQSRKLSKGGQVLQELKFAVDDQQKVTPTTQPLQQQPKKLNLIQINSVYSANKSEHSESPLTSPIANPIFALELQLKRQADRIAQLEKSQKQLLKRLSQKERLIRQQDEKMQLQMFGGSTSHHQLEQQFKNIKAKQVELENAAYKKDLQISQLMAQKYALESKVVMLKDELRKTLMEGRASLKDNKERMMTKLSLLEDQFYNKLGLLWQKRQYEWRQRIRQLTTQLNQLEESLLTAYWQ